LASLSASLDPKSPRNRLAARSTTQHHCTGYSGIPAIYLPGSGVAALPAAAQPFPLALIDICILISLTAPRLPRINHTRRNRRTQPRRSPPRIAPIPRETRLSVLRLQRCSTRLLAPPAQHVAASYQPPNLSTSASAHPVQTPVDTSAIGANHLPALRKWLRSRTTLWRACLPWPECS
jgi:hypothetical protein